MDTKEELQNKSASSGKSLETRREDAFEGTNELKGNYLTR